MNSKLITKWPDKAYNRAMLRAVGFNSKDLEKFQIGIVSTWSNITPCNNHINVLAKAVEYGTNSNLCKATIFNTITISDGISNGNIGMKYSLISRDIISSSIETVVKAQNFDGIISIGGCDKNIPGCILGMSKVNIPSIFIYSGTILPGKKRKDIITVFESLSKYYKKQISENDLLDIEKNSIIGSGSCGGMYTANSMAIVAEILGFCLPNSSLQNAQSLNKILNCINSGKLMNKLIKLNILPSVLINKSSIYNAIKLISLIGGSTNCFLHLLAISNSNNLNINLNDLKKITNNLPTISDLKPSGKYYISDLINTGGIQKLIKFLIKINILDGKTITITGNTLEQNLKNININYFSKILKNINFPCKKTNQIKILFGNISINGCIAKISGKEGEQFFGKSIVFNSEEESLYEIKNCKIKKKTVIVIRNEGPKGGPGMREMLAPTSSLIGSNLKNDVALITDGRFSGGSHGFVVGHICPESYDNGIISIVENNDIIIIDSINNNIVLLISKKKILKRLIKIKKKQKIFSGILNLYRKNSLNSSLGAMLNYE